MARGRAFDIHHTSLAPVQQKAPARSWWLDPSTREAFNEAAKAEALRMAGSTMSRTIHPITVGAVEGSKK